MEPDVIAELNRIGPDDWFEIQGYEAIELRDFILEKDKEIERLRWALKHISICEGGDVTVIWKEMRDIAIEALQQKDSE